MDSGGYSGEGKRNEPMKTISKPVYIELRARRTVSNYAPADSLLGMNAEVDTQDRIDKVRTLYAAGSPPTTGTGTVEVGRVAEKNHGGCMAAVEVSVPRRVQAAFLQAATRVEINTKAISIPTRRPQPATACLIPMLLLCNTPDDVGSRRFG